MPVSITATPSSSTANSYLSVADADAIATTMLGTLAWSTATSDDKSRALITATRGLDTLNYIGERTTTTQSLAWPRTGIQLDNTDLSDTTIPEAIRYSTFDLANALLTTPTLLQSDPTTSSLVPGVNNRDLRRLKLDVLELEWRPGATATAQSRVTPLTVLPHLATILGGLTTSTIAAPSTIAVARS